MTPIPSLPSNIQLEYFAEGAANVIYKIHVPPTQSLTPLHPVDFCDPLDSSSFDPPPPLSVSSSASLARLSTSPHTTNIHDLAGSSSPSTPPTSSISPPGSFPSSPFLPTYNALEEFSDATNTPLLRLRKALKTTLNTASQCQNYSEYIAPLLPPTTLLRQKIVSITTSQLATLNGALRLLEEHGTRPRKRIGTYLADDIHGVLVESMAPRVANEITIEFKPKWLAQSPNAPEDATRCRTCALRAYRTPTPSSVMTTPVHDLGCRKLCPLDLVSDNDEDISRAIECLMPNTVHPPLDRVTVVRNITESLRQSAILDRLRNLQRRLDSYGILALHEDEHPSADFSIAMALRDCTVFCRVGPGGPAEVKVGDLDAKVGEKKMKYWRDLEMKLRNGGWYTGHDGGDECGLVR